MTTALRSTSPAEVTELVAGAARVSDELAAMPLAVRAAGLRRVADALDAARDELVPIADAETNLGVARLTGEMGRTTGQLRLFAEVIEEGSFLEAAVDPGNADATPAVPDVRRILRSIGPVAVFAASNFPFAFSVAGGDTASALASGCPVVVKGHPGHETLSARTAEIVAAALVDAGWPEGSFSIVFGQDAGSQLVLEPAIAAVAFTGSLSGGKALLDLANSRPDPIPFYGELGSINPVIVTPAAAEERPDAIASGLVGSFTLGVGQFCTKPGVVLVPTGAGIESLVVEALADTSVPMLNDRIAQNFSRVAVDLGDGANVETLFGSAAQAGSGGSPVVFATTAANFREHAATLAEECFGPSTMLVSYNDQHDLEATLAVMPGSLTLTVQGTDGDVAWLQALVPAFENIAGRLIWNGWPTGVAVNWTMQHGGPWPSATTPMHTSVGATAVRRFLRPVAYQDWPEQLLPTAIADDVVSTVPRRVAGNLTS